MLPPLPHRAVQAIFLFVIVKAVVTEGFDAFFLLFVEGIILDISFDALAGQSPIVLIRAVSRIGHYGCRFFVIQRFMLFEVAGQGLLTGGCLLVRVVQHELLLCAVLQVVGRCDLPVQHMVFLDAHGGGIRSRLGVPVAPGQYLLLLPIPFQILWPVLFGVVQLLFDLLGTSLSDSASSIFSTACLTFSGVTVSKSGREVSLSSSAATPWAYFHSSSSCALIRSLLALMALPHTKV